LKKVFFAVAWFALALPSAAYASWKCEDKLQFDDGYSELSLPLHADGTAMKGIVNYRVYKERGELSMGWWPQINKLGQPFSPPISMSFSLIALGGSEKGYAIFSAPKRRALRLRISSIGPINTRPSDWILFQIESRDVNRNLLDGKEWQVSLFDRHGKKSGQSQFRFSITLPEIKSLYVQQTKSLIAKATDWKNQCTDEGEDADMAEIITTGGSH
jgi:hypothetical protein